jgi:hypothetical protein
MQIIILPEMFEEYLSTSAFGCCAVWSPCVVIFFLYVKHVKCLHVVHCRELLIAYILFVAVMDIIILKG